MLVLLPLLAAGCTGGTARSAAPSLLPSSFAEVSTGTHGGAMWAGVIPNSEVPAARRESAVYLPPNVSAAERYPLVILLHGFRGSPFGYVNALDFARVADDAIASGAVRPFVAIMPAAGTSVRYDGEWAGVWERFVVRDVLAWADRTLPVRADRAARAIGGDSAGGYGAVDIGLRHPRLFGTLEAWSGYFHPIADGPLTDAPPAQLRAHDPSVLARRTAPTLRSLGTHFFLSAGKRDRKAARDTRAFALELRSLRLPVRLHVRDGGHNGRFWREQLPAALEAAVPG
jgi:enterochelin esterase-like enzyme